MALSRHKLRVLHIVCEYEPAVVYAGPVQSVATISHAGALGSRLGVHDER